jgi:hypothetical protein
MEMYRASDTLQYGEHFATVINPAYQEVFKGSILHTMQGLAVAAMSPVELPGGRVVQASIFGFTTSFAASDPQTALLVPNMHRLFANRLEDPAAAIHSYHQGLVLQTNEALRLSGATYRLMPVPEQ